MTSPRRLFHTPFRSSPFWVRHWTFARFPANIQWMGRVHLAIPVMSCQAASPIHPPTNSASKSQHSVTVRRSSNKSLIIFFRRRSHGMAWNIRELFRGNCLRITSDSSIPPRIMYVVPSWFQWNTMPRVEFINMWWEEREREMEWRYIECEIELEHNRSMSASSSPISQLRSCWLAFAQVVTRDCSEHL